MGTTYPGFNTFTPGAQPATFGRFISGLSADDDDLDDAQHLMALGMACMDNCQFLGWHSIDPVNGGTYAYTTSIATSNNWTFNGNAVFDGAETVFSGTVVTILAPTYVGGGFTLTIGGAFGDGTLLIAGDSTIEVSGSSGHTAFINVNPFSAIRIKSGGLFEVNSGGVVIVDTNISETTDPGGPNRIYGTNVCKLWLSCTTDGAGGVTVDGDGAYNVAQVILDDAALGFFVLKISFTQEFSSVNYVVTGSIQTISGSFKAYVPIVEARNVAHVLIIAGNGLNSTSYIDPATNVINYQIEMKGRQ